VDMVRPVELWDIKNGIVSHNSLSVCYTA